MSEPTTTTGGPSTGDTFDVPTAQALYRRGLLPQLRECHRARIAETARFARYIRGPIPR